MSYDNPLNPNFGLQFQALYHRDGLLELDKKFADFLHNHDSQISHDFHHLKDNPDTYSKTDEAHILIDVARVLELFLAELFLIKDDNLALQQQHHHYNNIYSVRRNFIQRAVARKFNAESVKEILKQVQDDVVDGGENQQTAFGHPATPPHCHPELVSGSHGATILQSLNITYQTPHDLETTIANEITTLTNNQNPTPAQEHRLEKLTAYCALALFNEPEKSFHKDGALFILPQKIDHQQLVSTSHTLRNRDGFNLTDPGFSLNRVLGESNYCIFCHNQNKDSCRSGIKEKDQPNFKYDALHVELHGCPLDEKISEMNFLKSEGLSIAALAIATVDNPMIAGTGHRICNDCMKSCIFQKQDPVDIPQVETKTLRDVLSLPYGFEIYSLLTRWNPLNITAPIMEADSGKKVLIAGLGPAGYTLAHYLLNQGHEIIAIDGLKIEPLDPIISGIDIYGNRHDFKPIKSVDEIYEPLSERLIHGFGGVAEYGITVRWDKNFLKIIRLLLERRQHFRMFGGIRFGSSITHSIAFDDYGFDHVALCIGAGRPNIIDIKNNFAKGVRSASDFLMALQLTGAFKKDLFTNLQIRMPIVVVGAGLTAFDTACEAQAYYQIQVEKFAEKYRILSEIWGEEKILQDLTQEEKMIAAEFLQHAQALKNSDNPSQTLRTLGGVKILYRKKIQDSPAYRFNHQEINKAFEEGIELIENITPLEAILDNFGHIKALKAQDAQGYQSQIACKSLMVAAGTSPNLSPVSEDQLNLKTSGKYFTQIDTYGQEFISGNSAKPDSFSILTHIDPESKKSVSFFGDLHPNFEGNVVKAMASAKLGCDKVNDLLSLVDDAPKDNFTRTIQDDFSVTIHKINRFSKHSTEIFIKAPLLAKQTQLGQIFRLQNYHSLAPKIKGQTMAMEGVTVTALEVDQEQGLIRGIVLDFGGSTSLIKNFKEGDPAIFMGPSGKPTELAQNETVILVGGGRGNMPLTAIAKAYKENGCKIIFFAGYRKNDFVIRQEIIEQVSDVAIFAIEDEEPNLILNRSQDIQFKGSVTQAITAYGLQQIPNSTIDFQTVDRIFVIGNERMSYEVSRIRHDELKTVLNPKHIAITSLNAPMQCMLKGVCSQCLQKRFNEKEGAWEFFYACSDQDQKTDLLDFTHLKSRCSQNSLSEKISRLWIQYLKSI